MKYTWTFTVFTPTYNRAHTLHRVYESLKSQTFKDFEWLIVDDGSTDNTRDRVATWQREANFPIKYFFQENKGKHNAINRGVAMAQGELFLIADSDDAFVSYAMETFEKHWKSITESERIAFAGVCVLGQTSDGEIVGDPFPAPVFDATPSEMVYRYGVRGDKWRFVRTDVMKEFPFPVDVVGTLVPESLVWLPMGKRYKTRFINEPLCIIYTDQPGYLRGRPRVRYPWAGRQEHLYYLNEELPSWWPYAPLGFMRSALHYARFSFHLGISPVKQFKSLRHPIGMALWILASPLAWLVYARDKVWP